MVPICRGHEKGATEKHQNGSIEWRGIEGEEMHLGFVTDDDTTEIVERSLRKGWTGRRGDEGNVYRECRDIDGKWEVGSIIIRHKPQVHLFSFNASPFNTAILVLLGCTLFVSSAYWDHLVPHNKQLAITVRRLSGESVDLSNEVGWCRAGEVGGLVDIRKLVGAALAH
ncbi:unnamed protein product [Rodentolepis nana]|uniref:Transmembrane protein n=1 Tax=Rodentolepis nana TaxID=102285 RepID=A0A0R3TWH8_RODNA|nr:unnamed protein product [Rodentolepis nana]